MIPDLRHAFNRRFDSQSYPVLLDNLAAQCGMPVEFRVAETPVFIHSDLLESMARAGAEMAQRLIADPVYLAAARRAIPAGYLVAAETPRPHFLTADFALVRLADGSLVPRLVEIQAFPSVFAYQAVLCDAYRTVFNLPGSLGAFLSGLTEEGYWDLLRQTVLGSHDPENVVLTEIDPLHQKTMPDFAITASRLGIQIVDITQLHPVRNKLHYRAANGRLVPIHRIYNRAIADELIARHVQLPFDLTAQWEVEWAGHPNWYFLISKFSLPYLSRRPSPHPAVPPAVFLSDFLAGEGREELKAAGVALPGHTGPETTYSQLLLKPLFSFAGKGIQFDPTQAQLESIPPELRGDFLLQQRMRFEPTIETPHGLTQAEIRILYMHPDGGGLTPALSLVRLGRGRMMGVDHNRDLEWVGASAAFYPN
jgi:hypothetical protein